MDASDVVQTALLEATRDFGAFSGSTMAELRAWIRGILRRNVLDDVKAQVRAKKRAVGVESSLDDDPSKRRILGVPASHLTSPSQKIARRQEVARLLRIIDQLSDGQRDALDLWLAGYPVKEIAGRLGKTDLAVASLLKRALEYIRTRAATGH
jgi:RNA polymerase sigma-70 factor (ECF subfamily)